MIIKLHIDKKTITIIKLDLDSINGVQRKNNDFKCIWHDENL